jgi:hypothetical protein
VEQLQPRQPTEGADKAGRIVNSVFSDITGQFDRSGTCGCQGRVVGISSLELTETALSLDYYLSTFSNG